MRREEENIFDPKNLFFRRILGRKMSNNHKSCNLRVTEKESLSHIMAYEQSKSDAVFNFRWFKIFKIDFLLIKIFVIDFLLIEPSQKKFLSIVSFVDLFFKFPSY